MNTQAHNAGDYDNDKIGLCCSALQDLALQQLMQKQLLPYLRAGAAAVPVAVDRASRVLGCMTQVKGFVQGVHMFIKDACWAG